MSRTRQEFHQSAKATCLTVKLSGAVHQEGKQTCGFLDGPRHDVAKQPGIVKINPATHAGIATSAHWSGDEARHRFQLLIWSSSLLHIAICTNAGTRSWLVLAHHCIPI